MNWDSKQRAYSCFPIELDWVLGFTVPVQPNLRAVKCQHALATWVKIRRCWHAIEIIFSLAYFCIIVSGFGVLVYAARIHTHTK